MVVSLASVVLADWRWSEVTSRGKPGNREVDRYLAYFPKVSLICP